MVVKEVIVKVLKAEIWSSHDEVTLMNRAVKLDVKKGQGAPGGIEKCCHDERHCREGSANMAEVARDVKAQAGDAQKGIKENTPWIEVMKKQKRDP